ncbi:hypothetical protein PRUPE_1G095000 [Prunus persica]|uniref:TsaA-like domain-containing protein n=1 Tax=Prunus persica TaxID=3760 RepID=A0A251QXS9_PRUPE|nr:hypothetical protein PRUPE_1G095000 [Prunus persica]
MGYSTESKWLTATITFALAALSASTAFSLYFWKRKSRDLDSKIGELEKSLKTSLDNCAAERQGRIRAQQALRKALTQPKLDNVELNSYPMAPIGVIQSCFSTRNGTPRQPVLVPLSRACLIFNTARVPPASLEGLGEYSHCWVIYVFHQNTNLEKLWKDPTKSKFKAKVRVPTLNGERKGLFATRSPHRPSPIGLSVAKVEAVQGHMLLLSGVDLVDGTPVLDVKPYIPYCDSIQGARVPKWLAADSILAVASVSFSEVFTSTLADCWEMAIMHIWVGRCPLPFFTPCTVVKGLSTQDLMIVSLVYCNFTNLIDWLRYPLSSYASLGKISIKHILLLNAECV